MIRNITYQKNECMRRMPHTPGVARARGNSKDPEGFENLQGLIGRQAFSLSACPDSSGIRRGRRMRRKHALLQQQNEITVR